MPFFYVLSEKIDKTIIDDVKDVVDKAKLISVSITEFKMEINKKSQKDAAKATAVVDSFVPLAVAAAAAEATADAAAVAAKAAAAEAKAAAAADAEAKAADAEAKAAAAAAAEAKAVAAEAKAAAAAAEAKAVADAGAAVRVATEINQGNKFDCSELIIFEKNDSDLILSAYFFVLNSILKDRNVTIDMYGRNDTKGKLLVIVKSIGTILKAKAIFISIPRSVQPFYEENDFHPSYSRITREFCPGYERRSRDFFEGEPHDKIVMKYDFPQSSRGGKRKTTSQKSKRKNKQRKITKKRNRISSKKRKYYRP
jgi:chemotaxis protein histidine kinase CheA